MLRRHVQWMPMGACHLSSKDRHDRQPYNLALLLEGGAGEEPPRHAPYEKGVLMRIPS